MEFVRLEIFTLFSLLQLSHKDIFVVEEILGSRDDKASRMISLAPLNSEDHRGEDTQRHLHIASS